MPMVKFLSPADPKFLSTLKAIEQELVTDSLVFRYNPQTDGLDGAGGHVLASARSGTSRR